MKHPDIEIQIDELVLHGFPPMNRRLIKEAVETHLARMFLDGRMYQGFTEDKTIEKSHAVSINLKSDSTPGNIGKQIARSIYGEIKI